MEEISFMLVFRSFHSRKEINEQENFKKRICMACYRKKKGIGFAFCLKKAAEMPPFLRHLGRSKTKASCLVDFDGQRGSSCVDSAERQLESVEELRLL